MKPGDRVRLVRPLGHDLPAVVWETGVILEDDQDGGYLVRLPSGDYWGTYSAWVKAEA